MVITGNPAHIEQLDDNGNLMPGDAATLDYDNVKGIAVLTGNAVVNQKGRGEAHGDKLTYNTKTSQMTGESGGDGLVHMIFQPKNRSQRPSRRRRRRPRQCSHAEQDSPDPCSPPKVCRKVSSARQVVRDFGFSIREGEVVGLLGPNGAGKTTCFYMVVGLIEADAGSIKLDQQDITGAADAFARQAGHRLPAAGGLGVPPAQRGRQHHGRAGTARGAERQAARQRAGKPAGRAQDRAISPTQKGISLSGGERRRVEIARALAAQPRYMLLDEPFAGVDPISVGEIQRIVRHLKERGIGVLITDHNVRETLGICDRAYILNEGEVLSRGTPAHILADEKVREVYLGREFRL